MDKYSLPVCTEVFSVCLEKPVTFEDVLPEYCPGIRKILKADAVVNAADSSLSGGVIEVSAPCEIRVIYLADNGSLKAVSFSHGLDYSADASKISETDGEMKIFSKLCVPKVYAKPRSARSIEIKLDTSVSISVCTFGKTELFDSDLSGDTETRSASEVMTERIVAEKNNIEISDTITLDAALPAASEIIDRSLSILSSDCTPENGVLKFNGNAVFKCTYKAVSSREDGESEYIYLKKDIPVSGEIENEGISPDCKAVLDLSLCELDVTLSADPYGENRIIGVSAVSCAHAELFKSKELEFTYDGFCSSYECDFESTVYGFDTLASMIDKSFQMSESIPLNGISLTEITDTQLKLGTYSTELHEGKVLVSAKAYAVITGSDANGEPCCIEHRFVIKQSLDETEPASDRKYILCCNASSGEALLKDGELILDYTFKADGARLERKSINAISGADIHYDKPKPICRSEYIIYYPDKKETLWDIAKKYEIPQKKLAAANGIDETQVLNRKTVLIPCIS